MSLKESEQLISEAVELLPPQRKKVYQLSRIEGLTHAQIAQQLNISTSTVNNQLTEALHFIKKYLQETADAYIVLLILLAQH